MTSPGDRQLPHLARAGQARGQVRSGRTQRCGQLAVFGDLDTGCHRALVFADQAKWHDVVVENSVDLDVAAQGAHVIGQRTQVEVLRVLAPRDIRLGHLQHLSKLGLRLQGPGRDLAVMDIARCR